MSAERPALEGGRPVRDSILPYARQSVTPEDIEMVGAALRADILTGGPTAERFEEEMAARVGAAHGIAFSSATAGLHACMSAAGLSRGDESVTSPLTFVASANCALYVGALPVFADVSSRTLNLDPAFVRASLSARTRAIVAVDYAGHPSDLDELSAIAGDHELALIEDAAHSLGAEYRGKRVGGIATMTVFSFHPAKHIAAGEGGMVTTNDGAVANALRRFRNHGIDRPPGLRQDWRYDVSSLGFNYRMSDIAAALALSQLTRLDENLSRRRDIAERYGKDLDGLPAIELPHSSPEVLHAWHLYPIRLHLGQLRAGREVIFKALRAEGIGVNVHYVPVHTHSFYREKVGTSLGSLPVVESEYERLLSIPMFHSMSDEDVDSVVAALHKVVTWYAT